MQIDYSMAKDISESAADKTTLEHFKNMVVGTGKSMVNSMIGLTKREKI